MLSCAQPGHTCSWADKPKLPFFGVSLPLGGGGGAPTFSMSASSPSVAHNAGQRWLSASSPRVVAPGRGTRRHCAQEPAKNWGDGVPCSLSRRYLRDCSPCFSPGEHTTRTTTACSKGLPAGSSGLGCALHPPPLALPQCRHGARSNSLADERASAGLHPWHGCEWPWKHCLPAKIGRWTDTRNEH